jgi:hypothetical protein
VYESSSDTQIVGSELRSKANPREQQELRSGKTMWLATPALAMMGNWGVRGTTTAVVSACTKQKNYVMTSDMEYPCINVAERRNAIIIIIIIIT